MNIHNLREAQVHFEKQIDDVIESRQKLYEIREAFVKYYSPERINSMKIEHYAIGNELPQKGYNFCYTLERTLGELGKIVGATAFKFGVYYGKTISESEYKYRFTKKFGDNYSEAFSNVKSEILKLIESGKNENIDEIVENKISPMFKGKILSTYFPKRYLNVFSDEHLEYYLVQLNIDTHELLWSDAVIKREVLLSFKNKDEVMREWTVDLFSYFLYRVYPGRPPKENKSNDTNTLLEDYSNPNFPIDPNPIWIDMSIEPSRTSTSTRIKGKGGKNPDYEKIARKLKKYGDRGENLVLEMERKRLKALGLNKLAQKVKKVKHDYVGYDIISFEENAEHRYIEVKATSQKVGSADFFLSINELNKAKELINYYVYIVFDILSKEPKIWQLKNPFNPKNKNIKLNPISYNVTINAKEKK